MAKRCGQSARSATTAPTPARRSATSWRKKGEEGYVVSIGTFLQQFYIYGIEFVDSGNRVGMKRKELEPVNVRDEADELPLPGMH